MALRLVGAARQQKLPLSVAPVFENSQLDQMADQLSISSRDEGAQQTDSPGTGHRPRSIEESPRQVLPGKSQVAGLLSIPVDMICHILPVTDFSDMPFDLLSRNLALNGTISP